MASTNAKKKGSKLKSTPERLIYLIPLIIAIAVVPLIVFYKNIPLDQLSKQNWSTDDNVDFFSYYKSIFILISALGALLIYFYERYQGKIDLKRDSLYVPVMIYSAFTVLSALTSSFPLISRTGFADRYEGVFVLLSYMVLMLAAFSFMNGEKQIKFLLGALFISATILGLIGAFQFFGLDFFRSAFGKSIILPPSKQVLAKSLSFLFDKYTIYTTLYNTNFVGSYMAMLFPVSLVSFFAVKQKRTKVFLAIVTGIMFINWIGCRSRAGYFGGAIAIIILIIFFRKEMIKRLKIILPIAVLSIVIVFFMNYVSGGAVLGHVFTNLFSKVNVQAPSAATQATPPFVFKSLDLNGNKMSIIGTNNTLKMELKENQLGFRDTTDNELVINTDDSGKISFNDTRYQGINLYKDTQQNILTVMIGNIQLPLFVNQTGFSVIGQRGILINKIGPVEKFGFEGYETLGSSRGYIWSRSIPLLKNHLVLGSGPDTFAFIFPQYDVVGKLKAFGKVNEIVDKPHDLYLQIALNTGVISLIAILVLFAMYLLSSIKIYIKIKYERIFEVVGVSIFSAVCGYLATAFFNDSLVSVAPVFWILLGLGFSCNHLIKLRENKVIADTEKKSIKSNKNR